jgi:ribonuclease G
MKKDILINSGVNELRAAIVEDGNLAEYFIEFPEKRRIVGNIYLGKVSNIIQGINAAFVDIGFKNDAFLHFSDVDESLESSLIIDEADDDKRNSKTQKLKDKAKKSESSSEEESVSDVALRKSLPKTKGKKGPKFSTKKTGEFAINLTVGQDVIVQVTREAYSNKGVKVTSKISIAGRYLVFLPFDNLLGVSQKIQSYDERKRLRKIMRELGGNKYGCIMRTATKDKTHQELKNDWEYLRNLWEDMETRLAKVKAPTLLYQDVTLSKSLVRDQFDNNTRSLIVDSKRLYNDTCDYLKWTAPAFIKKVHLHTSDTSIFDHYGIEEKIDTIYERTVLLPGGGSLVFDQTEAMLVVDVNSGKQTGSDQEKTAVKTNWEALKEIAQQIRLRDIGGMIVVDFIDMLKESNRKKLYFDFNKKMKGDRAKWVTFPLSQLGLLQITRQRINQNIGEKVTDLCPTCRGVGRVSSSNVNLNQIERWLKNFKIYSNEFRLLLRVHPRIAEELNRGTMSKISKLMFKYFVRIKIIQDDGIPQDGFKFFSVRQQKEVTEEFPIL